MGDLASASASQTPGCESRAIAFLRFFSRENLKVVKRAIAWQLIQCDLGWRLLPNPTSQFLLKGNFERGEKGVAPDIP